MKKHPVVICSDKVNRYKFRVLASGIKLDSYTTNPIVLYAHIRPSGLNPQVAPVGKMHDIQLDDQGRLVGAIEFDQDDEFAVKLEKKWEKGMLNTVSLRAQILAVSDAPEFLLEGQEYPTVISSLLEEVSIEPIPGDSEAVALRLHYPGQAEHVISLSSDETTFDPEVLFPKPKPKTNMKLIQLALKGQKIVSLAADATEEQVAEALTRLVEKANESVQLAAKLSEKDAEILELKGKLEQIQLAAVNDKANALVDAAIAAKKITAEEKDSFVELAKTNYDAVKKILDAKKGFTSITEELNKGGQGAASDSYATLNYRELEQKGLAAKLKAENLELFKAKFKEFYGSEYKG